MSKSRCAPAFILVLAVVVVAPLYSATGSITASSLGASQPSPAGTASPVDTTEPRILASAPPALNVSLSCSSNCIGVKTRYDCTATASGGYGSQWYSFSWTGATPTSGSNANPNYAYKLLVPGGPCQAVVQVTLTDYCSTDVASRTIYDYCDSNCPLQP